ncbi:MAG: hypothetical protein FWD87_04155 [Spirochaetaceae bacterium]|nr:hypothetical protein [Spirochaetaceae bacterium]
MRKSNELKETRNAKGKQNSNTEFSIELSKVKKAFEDAGFKMRNICGDYIETERKNGVWFLPHFRKHQVNGGPRIWQVVWESSGTQPIRDRKWINNREPEILKKYNNCYLFSRTPEEYEGKIWIPVVNQEDPIKEMIEIVEKTKRIMEYW